MTEKKKMEKDFFVCLFLNESAVHFSGSQPITFTLSRKMQIYLTADDSLTLFQLGLPASFPLVFLRNN